MPTTTESPQSVQPNLPGSEVAQSNTPDIPNTRRDTNRELLEALYQPRTPGPEKRSEVASTPDASTSAQERKDTPADPQQAGAAGTAAASTTTDQTPTQPDPTLTPVEAARREEQSFKDRYYALELERVKDKAVQETQLEQQRLAQFGRVEAEAYQKFQSQVKPLEARAWSLHNRALDLDEKARDAASGGDQELANYFIQQRDEMQAARDEFSRTVTDQYGQFNNALGNHRQQAHTERLTQQEKAISRTLEKAGLTLDDLKATNPKLNMADNFAVIEAVAEAKEAKHRAEIKTAREEATRVEKEAKEKWRTDSPAARPDKPVSGGGSRNSTNRGGPGSGTSDIAAGLGLNRKR